jgi:poly(hydroxyalkanoate) granule-associated protein
LEAQIMSSDKSQRKPNGYQLGTLIRTSAHEIWLAGLGAYTRANKEGNRLFESLVEIGEAVEKKARDQVARPFRAAERQVEGAKSAVNDTWGRLEMLFDRRVARALHSLQIPTQRDVAELTERVTELQALVEELSHSQAPDRQASRPAVKKSAGKSETASRGSGKRAKPASRKRAQAPTRKKRSPTRASRSRKASSRKATRT